MAPFTAKFILLFTVSQQHSQCLPAPGSFQETKYLQASGSGGACSLRGLIPPEDHDVRRPPVVQPFGTRRRCSGSALRQAAGQGGRPTWQPVFPRLEEKLGLLQRLAEVAGARREKCVQVSLLFGNCLSGSAAHWGVQIWTWHLSSEQCESVPRSLAFYWDKA